MKESKDSATKEVPATSDVLDADTTEQMDGIRTGENTNPGVSQDNNHNLSEKETEKAKAGAAESLIIAVKAGAYAASDQDRSLKDDAKRSRDIAEETEGPEDGELLSSACAGNGDGSESLAAEGHSIVEDADELARWVDEVNPLPSSTFQNENARGAGPGAYAVAGINVPRSRLESGALTLTEAAVSGSASTDTNNAAGMISLPATLVPEGRSRRRSGVQRDLEEGGSASMQEPELVEVVVKEDPQSRKTILVASILTILVSAVVLLALGLAGVFSSSLSNENKNANSSTQPNGTTIGNEYQVKTSLLNEIRERGFLKCKYHFIPRMFEKNESTGEISGLGTQFCEVVAAAIFGPDDIASRVEYVEGASTVYNKSEYDIATVGDNPVVDRRRNFAQPHIYDGLRLVGDPFYVACGENDLKHTDECEGFSVCLQAQSGAYRYLMELLTRRKVVTTHSPRETIGNLIAKECNVVFTTPLYVNEDQLRGWGYTGGLAIGEKMFTKVFTSITTSADDDRFSDFVNAIVQSLFVAEKNNITQATAHLMPQTSVFGEDYKDMFKNAVAAVGNYDELYVQYIEPFMTRHPLNRINDGTSGLLYAYNFGQRPYEDEDPSLGTTLQEVLDRQVLKCGVRFGRPGFAMMSGEAMSGLEIDLCRALVGGLFAGHIENVEFVDLSDISDGYRKLASSEVDVIAGATWNLETDVQEPTTGLGYAFSQPYFYGYSTKEDNLCFATREDDHDWSAYVYWVVNGIIAAEEQGWNMSSFNEMPEVDVFGPPLKRMYKDSILKIGNYGEIYNRSQAWLPPRAGRNLLQQDAPPSPQHYLMPGII